MFLLKPAILVDLEEPIGVDASLEPSTSTEVSHKVSSQPRLTIKADIVVSKKDAVSSDKLHVELDNVCFF